MIINHNLNSMNAHRNMSFNTAQTGKAMEKLSSGLRINRAGDDAAGLAISEKMRGQIRGMDQAARNAQDGISLIQTAEGALNETHSIAQRMRELSVQSSNETNTADDRAALDKEFQQLKNEVTRIADQTEFNTKKLLKGGLGATSTAGADLTPASGMTNYNVGGSQVGTIAITSAAGTAVGQVDLTATFTDAAGNVTTQTLADVATPTGANEANVNFDKLGFSFTANSSLSATSFDGLADSTITVTGSAAKFQIGANSNQTIDLSIKNMDATALNIVSSDILTKESAQTAITSLDAAIKSVSDERANLGSVQNRLEHTINNLNVGAENLQAAESRIRDVDMAKEMMNFTKNNILNQAAQAMMSQSNQQPQAVLQLLR
ncbi:MULTISPECIES: flagellin [unclassified Exiguobacterium]|uniref:flagellin N-terminal helical domain-containing protein n=1 Tax=unclassified Exiguobacterium TaxID=2644629 RepID=UPI00103C8C82|nr:MULTISPECIES: flagellin [unclassified Exiguobacterium]TCI67208.1 flagellin [Exiguobacterium sp. IPCI3]TCI76666.1 flagellin [Exiguobacterium sp. IPCH1]TCI78317.1 flagellin [Exiguobacterium sp. IPBC4]